MSLQTQTAPVGLPTNVPLDILVAFVNRMLIGKLNVTGTITLTAGATSTTLTDSRIGSTSYIDFMPTTANAATAKANLYVSARTKGAATLTHALSANTDQTFVYVVIG